MAKKIITLVLMLIPSITIASGVSVNNNRTITVSGYNNTSTISNTNTATGSENSGDTQTGTAETIQTGAEQTGNNATTTNNPITINTGTRTIEVDTNTTTTQPSTTSIETIQQNNPPKNVDEEFEQALAWMYANDLTMYNNAIDYRPSDYMTREEASKIIGNAYIVLGFDGFAGSTNCNFTDLDIANPGLIPTINLSCENGLFAGRQNKFMPIDTFTRGQAITVLVKMIEGETINTNREPRRLPFYEKGKAINITTDDNVNTFERPITRREIAVWLGRVKSMTDTPSKRQETINQLAKISDTQASKTIDQNIVGQNASIITEGLKLNEDPEFKEAFHRLQDKGMTDETNINEFQAFENLLREEAAQYIYEFTKEVLVTVSSDNDYNCDFTDLNQAGTQYREAITQTCELGLFAGKDGHFMPKNMISKAEFIVVLLKILDGKTLSDNINPRRQNYFLRAQEIGLVTTADYASFGQPVSKIEIALILYRFNIRYKMLTNMNTTRVKNEILTTVASSINTSENNTTQAQVYIDTNLLRDINFDIGFVDLMGYKYKVVKKNTETYFSNNFVRYGELYDLIEDKELGTVQFIVGNGYVIEGSIRPYNLKDVVYDIKGSNTTEAFYYMTKRPTLSRE